MAKAVPLPPLPAPPPVLVFKAVGKAAVKPPPRPAFQGIAWDWTETNGPVYFEVWHTTDLGQPFTFLAVAPFSPFLKTNDQAQEFFIVRAVNSMTGESGPWGTR
jgi:hypothetical protein